MSDKPEDKETSTAAPDEGTPADETEPEVPQVSFGAAGEKLPDWREGADPDEPDDDDITEAPPDVIEMLGFDPFEIEDDEDVESTGAEGADSTDAEEPAAAPARQDTLRYATLSVSDAVSAVAVGTRPSAYATGTLKTAQRMLQNKPGFHGLVAAINAELAARA